MSTKRVVITGMGVITPLGTTPDELFANLIAGKSGVKNWHSIDTQRIYSKVGGDMGDYDFDAALAHVKPLFPDKRFKHLRQLLRKAPFSARLGILCAIESWRDAGLGFDLDNRDLNPFDVAAVLGGHNFNQKYVTENYEKFLEEPDFIDGLYALTGLDTYIVAAISDVLGIRGPSYTIGGACASTNLALRDAMREIQFDGAKIGVVAGAIFEVGPLDLQSMCLIDAITYKNFNDQPQLASRPYDTRREGFVPTHGAGTLIVEDLDHALSRNARIYAEVLGVQANCDANHLPQPSTEGQARLMQDLLRRCNLQPSDIDYVSAHATSTPLGDLTELRAIQQVFGDHAKKVKVNASKSMLGHCCWSAPVVESIAAIMQMNHGMLHATTNIDELDPEIELDVCADGPKPHTITHILKNSFGFSGINCCAIFKKYLGPGAVKI